MTIEKFKSLLPAVIVALGFTVAVNTAQADESVADLTVGEQIADLQVEDSNRWGD